MADHTQDAELLPCPFCGGKPEYEEDWDANYSNQVSCTECGAAVQVKKGDFSDWNRRSIPQGDEPAKTIDTPDFRALIHAYREADRVFKTGEQSPMDAAYAAIVAHAMQFARHRPRVKLSPEMKAALDKAHETGAIVAETPHGIAFINYGHDYGDNAHLECAACGGSGHIEDQRANAAAQGDELPPLPERIEQLWHEAGCAVSVGTKEMKFKFAELLLREYGAACRAGRAKGEDARDAVTEPKSCWSCGRMYTEDQRLDADGDCPHCGVEIEAAATAPEGKGENG